MTPLLLGGGDGRSRFGAQGRRWMQRTRPAKRSRAAGAAGAARTTGRAAANTGTAHHRLAGTNGATINWLAGDRRGTASRHPGPRSLLLLYLSWRWTGLLLLQARHHVGTRRYHGARGRLSSQIRARLRAQRCSWSWARQRMGRFGWRRRGTGHRMRGQSYRRWWHRRRRSCWWQRLPRTRQDLARTRRGNRASRNGTSAYGWMQRSSASRGQWRSQGRRFAAKRFFNCTNGGLLRGRCSGRLHFENGGFCNLRVMLNGSGLMPRGLFIVLDGLRLSNGYGGVGFTPHGSASATLHPLPDYFRHRLINRAGVGLLLGDTELGQHVDDGVRGDFQLPCELIDSNFTHK